MAGAKACGRSRNETVWLENQELPASLGQGIRFPLAPEPDFEIEDVAKDMRRFLRRSIREGADFYHRACDFENTAKEMRRYLPRSLREVIVDFSSGACEGKRLIEKVRRLLRRIDKKEALSATAEERDWSRNDGTDEESFIKAVSGGEIMVIMVRAWTFGGDKATLLDKCMSIFEEISAEIKGNPNHNHIVMFAESFFNNICYGDSKIPLTDDDVNNIFSAAEQKFGQTPALISFCFLHRFDVSNNHWLGGWQPPMQILENKGSLGRYLDDCYDIDKANVADHLVSTSNTHIANYNVFWWKGQRIAVYRKGMYASEVVDETADFVYEIGDWTTKLLNTGNDNINKFAEVLFGKNPLIVPRICADLSFPFFEEKRQCNLDRFWTSQLSKARLLLVSANGVPYYPELIQQLLSSGTCHPVLVLVDSQNAKWGPKFAVMERPQSQIHEIMDLMNYMVHRVDLRCSKVTSRCCSVQ